MEKIEATSLAKINFALEVKELRSDGYHELATLFQTISLGDRLVFRPDREGKVSLVGDMEEIAWDESNLIYRAALALKETAGVKQGVAIEVKKIIPPGRGLGGGSSNAAVTLMVLNRLWGLNWPARQLIRLGSSLGADVAFFFYGGLCSGVGRGEKLAPLPNLLSGWFVIVIPDFALSTRQVFQQFDALPLSLTSRDKESKIIQFLKKQDRSLFRQFTNDLELAAFEIYPQLADIKQEMARSGAGLSMMTGSGSAIYGFFDDQPQAKKAAERMKARYNYKVVLAETVGRERYEEMLRTGA
ncbi:MAG TPA: 4-(cytidine 5'-diphospho)-2-C-methyl-D-erythritol kinase [Candidatus Saccharicenans sp.]|jgi:4-diphosphocytidyl-2-C-methyl-D-erythritol kinase|nr:4-(cytidine 5'-diphospho)-2-C-methyl-D-erythritol kinase [Candidatus Saccharicenans sp.]HOJ26446.1 4-(cytidine 5'-diphospho)-2-C-methyl-D-erythritol kinase [Candidatus Saccharicenans sp.]HOL45462.1 4-(cytidine 5'-diphospho)-2-C-methyl-D-erythritol kinase [Candidatus Saccharicenans sp.]HOM94378.1 4-(cytidine 5'-diphospho)-2-C-methyl-D-erythritol kinase [Candidatus Saccharicenans sp.]HOT68903.1 4-(cytidine 5'-diphospho)-2-C-methyl-D-erythritol kinase [Candidatus Saccharicenans sp.]